MYWRVNIILTIVGGEVTPGDIFVVGVDVGVLVGVLVGVDVGDYRKGREVKRTSE